MLQSGIKIPAVFLLLITTSLGFAQSDGHLTFGPAKLLYLQSAFAHGYRHGYEEGFHVGDQDLQMGRRARPAQKISGYKQGLSQFRHEYGDKNIFDRGYRQGFIHGYENSYAGQEFQAVRSSRVAALGMSAGAMDQEQRQSFDQGFAGGYEAALKNPDQNQRFERDSVVQFCEESTNPKVKQRETYCQGYARGLLFGVAQTNQAESEIVARNGRR